MFFNRSTIGKLKNYDFFAHQKEAGLHDSLEAAQILGNFLTRSLKQVDSLNPSASKKLFIHLMELCLWGNKCDLCISSGNPNAQQTDPLQDLDTFRPNILSDNMDVLWTYLTCFGLSQPGEISEYNIQFSVLTFFS
jgi:hypothetical protein